MGTLFMLLMFNTVMAQKQFTLEDLNFGGTNYRNMVPENRFFAWWDDELVRLDSENCYLVDKQTGKEKTLFTLKQINDCIDKNDQNRVYSLYYVEFPYKNKPIAKVQNSKGLYLIDFKKHELVWQCKIENPQNLNAFEWNSQSKALAYVRDNQLHVVNPRGNDAQITTDGSRNIVYGQSVHRNEFGINGGLFWSPNGGKLAFYRMDQTMVTDYPHVNIFERIAQYEPDKYPMAGETSHKVTVGVYNMQTGRMTYLQTGDPTNRYFTNVQWSPDSKTIYMFELNRDQNDCRLVSYDAQTGEKLAELYRETDSKYVEPSHPIVFLPWDNEKFILQSQKDGFNHLYLFNTKGEQLKQITKGSWVVMDLLGFNLKAQSVVYTSNEKSPIQCNVFSANIKNGKRKLLDNGNGWHSPTLSKSGNFLCDNYSEPAIPRRIEITNSITNKRKLYFSAADPWRNYQIPEFSCGEIKAADGKTNLYYRMVKPAGFDPSRKYPTVIYVYGGPHAHNVDARWHYGSRGWETYMAQKGYLLFILDNRGSENRGKDFEQVTFRQLGQEEMKDQMEGVRFLKSLPYVDANRIGVHGWSFGGFMSISLMTHYPEVFKVCVAGGPVIDWKWYEIMYGERYMDTPQSNPDGYRKTSLLCQAKNVKGKLQIIIGYNDPVVVPQHALSFISECIKHGTQPDFFVYPGEPHNMRGHQSVHLHERITQYFEDYLK